MDFTIRTRNGSLNSMWETFSTWTAVLKKNVCLAGMSLQQRLCRTWKVCDCTCHSTFANLLHVLEIWNKKFIVPPCSQWLSVSDQQMFNRFMSLAQNVYLTTLFSKIPKKLKYSNVQRSKITALIRTFMFFSAEGMQIVCNLFVLFSSSSVEMKLFFRALSSNYKRGGRGETSFFWCVAW